jgi:hypothetical protein
VAERNADRSDRTKKGFEKALGRHGFGFHYRVVRECIRLRKENRSPWMYVESEFPFEVQGYGTRVDFILKHSRRPFYIVAECKRANPALSNWCFAKNPFTHQDPLAESAYVETIQWDDRVGRIESGIVTIATSPELFHIGLEVRTTEKGDPRGRTRGAIEDAATQVCRALNGMMDFFAGNTSVFGDARTVRFLPVVFTTARLYVSDVDLGDSDLQDGTVDLSDSDFREKPWLFYHYHQSPGLKHSVPPSKPTARLTEILYKEYVRTIPVVSASGIAEFLGSGAWEA